MSRLSDVLLEVLEGVPFTAGGAAEGVEVAIDSMDLEIPIEARLSSGGDLLASLPRGQLSTGFDPPVSRITLKIRRVEE